MTARAAIDYDRRQRCYDRRKRWVATALTWLHKASWMLRADADRAESEPWRGARVSFDAHRLLVAAVEAAERVAPLLSDEDVVAALPDVEELRHTLRDRARARKLEMVDGRTEAEAEAFLAKAAELRRRA
jgi:hypothetical protein